MRYVDRILHKVDKLYAASMYSGAQNLGAVQGYQQGYKFAADSERAEQDARIKGEAIKQKIMETKLKEATFADVMGEDSIEEQQAKQIQVMQKQITDQNTNTVRKTINEIARDGTAKDRDATLSVIKTRFKTNPEVYKALGIKNPNTMGVLNPMDSKDRKWMIDTLAQQGVTEDQYDSKEEFNDMLKGVIDSYPAIKSDGAIVDLLGLSTATGAASMANPTHNKIMEKNLENLRTIVDRRADNMESALSTEPGEEAEYKDTTGLNTVDPMAVERGDASVDADSMTDEGAEYYKQKRTDRLQAEQDALSAEEDTVETDIADSTAIKDVIKLMDSHETGGTKSYTARNPKTGAYGRYQFMPPTMRTLQKRLGLPLTKTPSKNEQDAMYMELMNEHKRDLVSIGVKPTAGNLYALHQLGGPVGKDYLKGNITPKVISSMKNQFSEKATKGKSPQEILDMWENRFTKEGHSKVSNAVTYHMKQQGGTAPLSDMRMRKIYALLGKTYPKDPNEPTTKMKNYEYLRPIVGDDMAYDAIWGRNTSTVRKSQLGKLYDELDDAKALGQTDRVKTIEQMIKNTVDAKGSTKTKIQYDRAREENKRLEALGRDSWDEDQLADYNSNREVIQGYEKNSKEQTMDAEINIGEEGRDLANESLKTLDGNPIDKTAVKNLEKAQRKLRQANPKTYQDEKKAIEDMKLKQTSVNRVADVLNRVYTGDLKDIKRGAVDSLKQWGATKLDKNTREMMDEATDGKWSETAKQNLKLGTALGLLQAEFIKAISGATVTDEERKKLVQTMVGGGGWDTEEALKIALQEFYERESEALRYSGDQLKKGTSPYAGYQFSQVNEVNNPSDRKIVRRGKTADGRTVVQYEDGTTEVQ